MLRSGLLRVTIARRIVAEAVGTALLLVGIVGSGIMGERLAGGNVVIALLANTLATGGILVALILTFGPVSGAHFNPVVTLAGASQRGLPWREVPGYVAAQLCGAFLGVGAAHLMFGEVVFSASRHARSAGAQVFSEFVATFGLMAVIWGCTRHRPASAPFAVGAYIVGAYCSPHPLHLRTPRDAGAFGERHVCRDTARGCAWLHPGAVGGSGGGNVAVPMAHAFTAGTS
jgi:glycerol uptake facilitator-like aquaporin